ncbi:MAG: hypothetical protein J0H49_06085 [Acidobacteria bacterium]|nr:hypothetical protein [Acidobacteriota bacterium]
MRFVSDDVGEDRLLDGADADADPGVIAAQGLDHFGVVFADPERGVRDDSAVDAKGFGPEFAFELEEAAFVTAEHEAMDEQGPEARIGDVCGFLQSFAVEEVRDSLGQLMELRIQVVAARVLGDAALAFGGAGPSRFLGVGAVGGEAALGDGLLRHGRRSVGPAQRGVLLRAWRAARLQHQACALAAGVMGRPSTSPFVRA